MCVCVCNAGVSVKNRDMYTLAKRYEKRKMSL